MWEWCESGYVRCERVLVSVSSAWYMSVRGAWYMSVCEWCIGVCEWCMVGVGHE